MSFLVFQAEIVKDLNELQDLTIRTGGLPTGLKADDVKKTVRRKKALGNWTTSEEIAYQALCREVRRAPESDRGSQSAGSTPRTRTNNATTHRNATTFSLSSLLSSQIAFQQNPNKDKDIGNPL